MAPGAPRGGAVAGVLPFVLAGLLAPAVAAAQGALPRAEPRPAAERRTPVVTAVERTRGAVDGVGLADDRVEAAQAGEARRPVRRRRGGSGHRGRGVADHGPTFARA